MGSARYPDEITDLAIDLAEELATEIDLHYEDHELVAAADALTAMNRLLAITGRAPGDPCLHIMARFRNASADAR